uniref:Red chlorophyll catabolite reductase, chloroplastic n=1 Tax=Aegilops tauschii TaxID=37682 RepID=M8B2V6_AEGTA
MGIVPLVGGVEGPPRPDYGDVLVVTRLGASSVETFIGWTDVWMAWWLGVGRWWSGASSYTLMVVDLGGMAQWRLGVRWVAMDSCRRTTMSCVVVASMIDFMLHSSLHCKVPNGAIDITSVLIFLNALTDAPHFLMEFIQGSPTSMVVILDLLPRKDLALHPEYLHKYYEHTCLDKQREKIEELPQTRPYRSPSLFVRSACSPTAVSVTIDCGQGGEGTLEEIVCGHLASAVKEVLQIWLHSCARDTSEMEEAEREIMIKRDQAVRLKSIEVDLTANLPRMFGPDVSGHIIAEIRKAFGVQLQEA